MEEGIILLKALGDINRINILKIISKKNICAKGIASRLNISEAAVSQHIKILKEADLISGFKRGYNIIYKINKGSIEKAKEFIETFLSDDISVSFSCKNECNNNKCYYKNILREDLTMKICFPVNENRGLETMPYGHFGTAPMFVICDLENDEVRTVNNGDLGHEHGKCQPMKALSNEVVDAVIVGGIGAGAINKLNSMNIKVYKAIDGNLLKNIEAYKNNNLVEFLPSEACAHHDCK